LRPTTHRLHFQHSQDWRLLALHRSAMELWVLPSPFQFLFGCAFATRGCACRTIFWRKECVCASALDNVEVSGNFLARPTVLIHPAYHSIYKGCLAAISVCTVYILRAECSFDWERYAIGAWRIIDRGNDQEEEDMRKPAKRERNAESCVKRYNPPLGAGGWVWTFSKMACMHAVLAIQTQAFQGETPPDFSVKNPSEVNLM